MRRYLPCFSAYLEDDSGGLQQITVFVDSGCSCELVLNSAVSAEKVRDGHTKYIEYSVFGKSKVRVRNRVVDITLVSADLSWKRTIECRVVDDILENTVYHDTVREKRVTAQVCLGSAMLEHIAFRVEPGHIRSVLGTCRTVEQTEEEAYQSYVHGAVITNEKLHDQLQRFWALDNVGNADEVPFLDQFALDLINEKTVYKDGRYAMPLLFKPDAKVFRNNYEVALRRFLSLERRLNRSSDLRTKYSEAMHVYLDKYAERVPSAEFAQKECCYLPHSAVIKENRQTTKVRVVHDASAKGLDGFSINDCLMSGPKLHPDIIGILLRFRQNRVGLMADISKMFFQIANLPEERKFHRFLWRENDSEPIQHYQMTVTTFGFADSPVKAIYCTRMHAFKYIQGAAFTGATDDASAELVLSAIQVLTNMFVDDLLTGANDIRTAFKIFENVRTLMLEGGFSLEKWVSNNEDLMAKIPEQLRGATETVTLTDNLSIQEMLSVTDDALLSIDEQHLLETTKALGVAWDVKNDHLIYNHLSVQEYAGKFTKRLLASVTARLFDPLGAVAPFIIVGKMLLQECWRQKLTWDEEITNELLDRWLDWCSQIPLLCNIWEARAVEAPGFGDVLDKELHAFCDASEKAMGAVVYVKVTYRSPFCGTTTTVSRILAKGKVAPIHAMTLPRKELVGLQMGAQLIRVASKELNLPIEKCFLHTDSRTAVQWVQKGPFAWKVFVKNRVQDILDVVPASQIFHVPGKQNPADIVSRGCKVEDLGPLWFNGPRFLSDSRHADQKLLLTEDPATKSEMKTPVKHVKLTCIAHEDDCLARIWSESNFKAFLNKSCYMLKMAKCMHFQGKPQEEARQAALRFWIAQRERVAFAEEIDALQKGSKVKKSSKLLKLDPYFDKEDKLL